MQEILQKIGSYSDSFLFDHEKIEKAFDILKNPDISVLSFNPSLIKRDILKTLILTLIIISFEVVLYLKLR